MYLRNRSKSVVGIGTNDVRKSAGTPEYTRWVAMLYRCYSDYTQEDQPTYKGCSVVEPWHLLSNFSSWMNDQDYAGKSLDKDLLGCTFVYSPENCCFISQRLNNLIGPRGLIIPMTAKRASDFEACLENETDKRVIEAVKRRYLGGIP